MQAIPGLEAYMVVAGMLHLLTFVFQLSFGDLDGDGDLDAISDRRQSKRSAN